MIMVSHTEILAFGTACSCIALMKAQDLKECTASFVSGGRAGLLINLRPLRQEKEARYVKRLVHFGPDAAVLSSLSNAVIPGFIDEQRQRRLPMAVT